LKGKTVKVRILDVSGDTLSRESAPAVNRRNR